jgi:hypothetical protein
MAANSSLSLVSLDFDNVKSSLKQYLKSQSVFRDYDFDGSNMNVLLDVLSYNTFMNAFYLNMAASEGFLDSAQLRSSVISHAKELNYTPRSARSSEGVVNVTFTVVSGNTNAFEIPKGTQFSGTNSNGGFTFVTSESHTLTSASNIFVMNDLSIYEGSYINETFTVDNSIESQKFILSNPDVDTTSISVTLIEDDGATLTDFSQALNLYGLNANSNVYFVQSTLDGYYEIVFGDGTFGRLPKNNASILVTYRVTNGDAANQIQTFTIDRDLGTFNSVSVNALVATVSPSSDGATVETIESIRYRAPRHYQTQDRAITTNDYANMIYENYPEIKAVNVYGGETVFGSVEYGKVFISPVSYSGATITNSLKTNIINYLSNKNSVGITPVIVDPNFIYIVPTITAYVDFNKTTMSPADVKSLLLTSVSTFNSTYLQDFNTAFRYSKFVSELNDADISIASIQVQNLVKKVETPALNVKSTINFDFHQEISPGTISSGNFLLSDGLTYSLTDFNPNNVTFTQQIVGNGIQVTNSSNVIYLKLNDPTKQTYVPAGTVDYTNGKIAISSVTIADFLGSPGIALSAETLSDDIYGLKNDLIEIDINNISIQVVSA